MRNYMGDTKLFVFTNVSANAKKDTKADCA